MQEFLAPILIFTVLGGAVCFAIYAFVWMIRWSWQSYRVWAYNRSRPIETFAARCVVKRTETVGNSYGYQYGGRVATYYYVSFEFRSGERREYAVHGADYGLIAEGDEGHLTFKGTVFYQFLRDGVKG
jgi:hypothetical protein